MYKNGNKVSLPPEKSETSSFEPSINLYELSVWWKAFMMKILTRHVKNCFIEIIMNEW